MLPLLQALMPLPLPAAAGDCSGAGWGLLAAVQTLRCWRGGALQVPLPPVLLALPGEPEDGIVGRRSYSRTNLGGWLRRLVEGRQSKQRGVVEGQLQRAQRCSAANLIRVEKL